MTIEVSICNKDAHKRIEITFLEFSKDTQRVTEYFGGDIGPLASATYHVHLLRDIRIREMKP